MIDLQRIITSREALTLASVPNGFVPLLLADLTRAAKRARYTLHQTNRRCVRLPTLSRFLHPSLRY